MSDEMLSGNTHRSTVGETCPLCRTIHCARDVVAVSRFKADGPSGYRPANGGVLRSARAEAMADICHARTAHHRGTVPQPETRPADVAGEEEA